jgi:hypothetical protein
VGGVVLFVSSAFWLAVLLVSVLGEKGERPPVEFAKPLTPVAGSAGVWDRLGLWTAVAAALIAIAYAYPIAHLILLPRFGSSPFKPF